LEAFEAVAVKKNKSFDHPVLIDRFLEDAIEVDGDAIRDKTGKVIIGGILEHVEEAGVHSGDSACVVPTQNLDPSVVSLIEDNVVKIANELNVLGPINVQFAVQKNEVFVIEANPRASRTLPFTSKAIGVPLAKVAALTMAGYTFEKIQELKYLSSDLPLGSSGNINLSAHLPYVAVKEAVLPFYRFPEVDALLGPEMRSTGEVMGVDLTFGAAFAKSQAAAGSAIPKEGKIFISLADRDKPQAVKLAKELVELGFSIIATEGTAEFLKKNGIPVSQLVMKRSSLLEGLVDINSKNSQDIVNLMEQGEVTLIINTPRGRGARADGDYIRRAASAYGVPCITTVSAAIATLEGMKSAIDRKLTVRTLQELEKLR
jgi:carbamoyl-phosphate synthase large subunit